jgi:hypothetical protein
MMYMFLIFGFLFGYFLLQARLNRFDTIGGMAMLEDYTVAKAIMVALGVGTLLISVEIALGAASFHIKPFVPGALVAGGLIFGAGMAILGYCPGTLMISLGEGSLDALAGIAGGVAGGVAFYFAAPFLGPLMGINLGKLSLYSITGGFNIPYFLVATVLSVSLVWGAFFLHRIENGKNMKWLFSGAGLAVLNGLMFMNIITGTPMGASSLFPWAGGIALGLKDTVWFDSLRSSGSWQMYFLGGAFLAGLFFSILRKEFRLRVIHARWEKYKGNDVVKRLVYAFIGGFLLLFGARMAGGCTSGHVISGGMQVALSSYLFALFTFAGLLLTGRIFYRRK